MKGGLERASNCHAQSPALAWHSPDRRLPSRHSVTRCVRADITWPPVPELIDLQGPALLMALDAGPAVVGWAATPGALPWRVHAPCASRFDWDGAVCPGPHRDPLSPRSWCPWRPLSAIWRCLY